MSKFGLTRAVLIPLFAVVTVALVQQANPVLLQTLQHVAFDQYQRWSPREGGEGVGVGRDSPVRVIDIDDQSLARLGQWPWPRTQLADLIQKLNAAQPAAIALDVIFSEPDRTSPSAMLKTWAHPPGLGGALRTLPDHDEVFAQAIAQAPVVMAHVMHGQKSKMPYLAQPFRTIEMGPSPLPHLHEFSSTITSLPVLQRVAPGNGSVNFIPDKDGVVRRVMLVSRVGKTVLPSLDLEALRVAQGERNIMVKTSADADVGLESIRVGALNIPVTSRGEMWVHYGDSVAANTIPAWKVLAGQVPDAELRNRVLLLGTSAAGLKDLRFSPLGEVIPGVQVHAQALEQILRQDYLNRPNWLPAFELALIVVCGLLIGLIALNVSALWSAGIAVLMLSMVFGGGLYVFAHHQLLLDAVTPSIALILSFALASGYRHVSAERRQRWVKQAFSRYVSPNLVAYLVDHPDSLQLGGRRQECSFIFTDLAGFTNLMENIDPTEAVGLLNHYLDEMIAIAFKHEGTLDRIVGDAVAVIFSAPVEQADHRQRAFDCALEMQVYSNRYMSEANARGIAFGMTRIGVHTGEVTVGNFGGSTIFDYRALGDPINTAARLESVNKQLGTQICVSEATLSGCANVIARPVGKLVLKGKSAALMVYEPVAQSDPDYLAAYQMMAAEDASTLAHFTQLAELRPQDPLVKFHLGRLSSGQTGEVIVFSAK